jgi:hypothetical protein
VSRLLFFVLLIANAAFGAHLWLSLERDGADFSRRERNRDEIKLVAVIPPLMAARTAEQTRVQVQSLAGAACVEFTGVSAEELPKAKEAFAAMKLGERLIERRVEEITRHWVFIAPAKDRRAADQTISKLRRAGVTDFSLRPDLSISLGVFSTEEAARRYLATVEFKLESGAQVGPFSKEARDLVFLVREPDTEVVARLALLQREFAGSVLRAVTCPPAETSATASAPAGGANK